MQNVPWGELGIGAVAILALAISLIQVVKSKNGDRSGGRRNEEAALEKLQKTVENNTAAMQSNTAAMQSVNQTLQKVWETNITINAKSDEIIRHVGGGVR